MLLTVFTPTYNRAYRLPDLYESLKRQTLKDFEWIIVDDGSTDNTKDLVEGWINEKSLPIRYLYTENGGKHRAINKGVKEAKGDLFFIVDSDDFLTDNSLERIEYHYNQIKGNEEFAGVVGLKISPGGKPHKLKKKYNILDCYYYDIKKYIGGDLAEIYYSNILKKYPFPEYEGENFIAESTVWRRIAQKYKLRYFFEGIYICEYLPDGLSANIRQKQKMSPKGRMLCCKEGLYYEKSIISKIKCGINYWVASIGFNGIKDPDLKLPWWGFPLYPLGLIVYHIRY